MKYKTYNGLTVYVDARLRNMPNAQCGITRAADGSIKFISYTTLVCIIDAQGWLSCTGTYSQTTRKQIGRFLKEYAPNLCYQDAKYCYENNVTMNIYTREIADLPY